MGFTLGRPRQREEWRSEAPANQMAWIGVVGAERAGANRRGEVVAEGHIVLRDSLDRRLDGLANPLSCPFSLVRLWVLAIAGTGRGEFRGVDLHAGIAQDSTDVVQALRFAY